MGVREGEGGGIAEEGEEGGREEAKGQQEGGGGGWEGGFRYLQTCQPSCEDLPRSLSPSCRCNQLRASQGEGRR
eukprot:759597-Hanusia_phi.AAC.2